jgi:hypothetical protein
MGIPLVAEEEVVVGVVASSRPCVGGNVMLPRLVNDISLIEDERALTRHRGVGVKGVAFFDMVDEITDDSHWREPWKFQCSGWTSLAEIRSPRVYWEAVK